MDDKEFGLRVRNLRERAEITREDFCGDEIELSIRQLSRIETGSSKPTFSKISFIADRLGMTLYELMPDYVELDSTYLHLKYQVLRTPTYGEERLIQQRDEWLDQIYENFYEELPEEEQIVIDTLRSIFDVIETGCISYGKDIIADYFYQSIQKSKWTVNDLTIFRLFIAHTNEEDITKECQTYTVMTALAHRLTKEIQQFDAEALFVVRDLLFAIIHTLYGIKEYEYVLPSVNAIEHIMKRTQDFQKKPILQLVKWKYALEVEGNAKQAKEYYQEAILFAKLLDEEHLVTQLEKEWQLDSKNKK